MEGNFEDKEAVGGRGMEGYLFGSYRVIRALGEGGMGAVYEVVHEKLGVHYALKTFILSDGYADLFRKRFQAEGKILARRGGDPGRRHIFAWRRFFQTADRRLVRAAHGRRE